MATFFVTVINILSNREMNHIALIVPMKMSIRGYLAYNCGTIISIARTTSVLTSSNIERNTPANLFVLSFPKTTLRHRA